MVKSNTTAARLLLLLLALLVARPPPSAACNSPLLCLSAQAVVVVLVHHHFSFVAAASARPLFPCCCTAAAAVASPGRHHRSHCRFVCRKTAAADEERPHKRRGDATEQPSRPRFLPNLLRGKAPAVLGVNMLKRAITRVSRRAQRRRQPLTSAATADADLFPFAALSRGSP